VALHDERLAGLAYSCRYQRPTHYLYADLEKVAVAAELRPVRPTNQLRRPGTRRYDKLFFALDLRS
jgi:hypothetical protein